MNQCTRRVSEWSRRPLNEPRFRRSHQSLAMDGRLLGNTIRRAMGSGFIVIGSLLVVACGGGSHSSVLPLPLSHPGTVSSASPSPNHGFATAVFTFHIPLRTKTATSQHTPQYIPSTVQSVQFTILEVNGSVPVPAPTPASFTIPGSACTLTSGEYTCTLPVQLPVGNDLTQISTYDGSANLLSQQVGSPLTVVPGTANAFGTSLSPITLDAAPGAITANGGSGVNGAQPNFRVNFSGAVTFNLSQVDGGGTAFGAQPGQPTMTHTAATGAGASASITGSTLTLTQSSAGFTNVVVEADPAGTQDVTTTLTSSPDLGATNFTVASTNGIYPGANLILDYETLSNQNIIQESALVTAVNGTTITVASGLSHPHSSGAGIRHYSDNLVSSANLFTVALNSPLIVVVGNKSGVTKVIAYNESLNLQPGSLTENYGGATYFPLAGLDANGSVYFMYEFSSAILRSTYTAGSGFSSPVTFPAGYDFSTSGVNASSNGTLAFTGYQLTIFSAATSGSPITFSPAFHDNVSWNLTPYTNNLCNVRCQTVAVLTDGSSNVFGYAVSILNGDASVNYYYYDIIQDQIAVTDGSSEQDIQNGAIMAQFYGPYGDLPSALTWDQGRQSLIYVSSQANRGISSRILEFPRNGTSGASLLTTPTTVGTMNLDPWTVAASKDGSSVAVAWGTTYTAPVTVSIYHNNGGAWSLASGGSTLERTTFANFQAMHFLANGNLLIADSDGSTYANLWQFTGVGSPVGSPYNAQNDLGSGYGITDFAVSP
ncbi:MAG TPA: hypothetical protein VGZ00_03540 [Candidatus Baltobacteraceae bacterium]|nr:hypothetical protein [Candidatus Baltobacteraceae bacterium]